MQTVVPNPESTIASSRRPLTSPSILKPQPVYPHGLPHSYTDPLPLPNRLRKKSVSQPKSPLQLPQGLVISGLESGSDSTQRALTNVLAEKRVVLEGQKDNLAEGSRSIRHLSGNDQEDGVWNLPEGFIVIYVCPWNARERPAIHKSLLDKFAMSTNVFIAQNIRRDFHSLPFSPAPRPFHPTVSHSNPGSPSPAYATALPPTHTPPIFTKSLPANQRHSAHFNPPPLPDDVIPWSFIKVLQDACSRAHISYTLSLYLSDIFSATRHNSRLDAMLLTARSMRDAEDLIRASRVIGADLTGMELVRMPVNSGDVASSSEGDSQDQISSDYVRLGEEQSSTASVHNRQLDEQAAAARVLDVSEVDIARIVPRVISHRVRLRDGPEDEVLSSAFFGATFKPPIPLAPVGEESHDGADNFQSVKAVLVNILSEV
ncbi:hypothetical protein GALMADRAFT_79688 [Galerina marginata CBS 339.88]|uniref:Uncharacterized protein n=1 Tax=Galerina marginata (strain CBS 339.88) TaxID=685588 RepID=A0A067S9J7_GALM3|nr:hypothetical protein GALMADRAFT_79688 [Galerina marginata CBS 339.88]